MAVDETPTGVRVTARMVHHTATRTRYHIDGGRGDGARLASMAQGLETLPEVERVVCNPLTGSLLVHHSPRLDSNALSAFAERQGYFRPQAVVPRGTPIQELRKLYRQVEQDAVRASGGRLDIESVTLAILAAFTVAGFMRGNIAFPAGTALWYAMDLIRVRSAEEPPEPGGGGSRASEG